MIGSLVCHAGTNRGDSDAGTDGTEVCHSTDRVRRRPPAHPACFPQLRHAFSAAVERCPYWSGDQGFRLEMDVAHFVDFIPNLTL